MTFRPRGAAEAAYRRYGRHSRLPQGLVGSGEEPVIAWAKGEMARLYPDVNAFEVKSLSVDYARQKTYPRLEIHHNSPQAYIPVDRALAIPVASAVPQGARSAGAAGDDVAPGADAVQFFSVQPGEAVFVDAGVWHGGPVALDEAGARFVVLLREGTSERDTVKKAVEPPIALEL